MKSVNSQLVSFLRNSTSMVVAELYKITLSNGTIVYWTNSGSGLTTSSGAYSVGPVIEREQVRSKVGLEVDSLAVVFKGPDVQVLGLPLTQAASNGAFDGAYLELRRIVMATYGDVSLGDFLVFAGRISTVAPSSSEVKITAKSDLELLNIQMPRNMYSPGCGRVLFDAGCGVNRAEFAKSDNVTGGTRTTVQTSLTDPAGYFDLGMITFDSGPNAGISRTVKSYVNGLFTLIQPLPYAASGSITAVPGCDKTHATCSAKFDNIAAVRGVPFIPKPESAR